MPDGKTGLAIKKDGDIVSGFSLPVKGKGSRIGQLLILAISKAI